MGDGTVWDYLIRIAVGAVAIYVTLRLLVWRRADFTVRVRAGAIDFRGKFPLAWQAALAGLLREMNVEGSATILGRWQGQRLRVWFRGALTEGQKQRIRNFLLTGT
jgi:hypothetical protein